MSRTISFEYKYPYFYYNTKPKYGVKISENQETLNGNYIYSLIFNNEVQNCTRLSLSGVVTNVSGNVLGQQFCLMVYRVSYGWYNIANFYLSDGNYSIDANIGYRISKFVVVPRYQQSSSVSWTTTHTLNGLWISENITTVDLLTNQFHYGIFPNYYGINQNITEVYVNVDGVLKKATNILVNLVDTLGQIPKVYSGYFKTTSEAMCIFEFTPPITGSYVIRQKSISGDHEIRLYDSSYNMIDENYFYNKTFTLTGGSLYYISVTHYYNNTNIGESYLQIYKP